MKSLNLTDEQQNVMLAHTEGLNKLTKKYESPLEKKEFNKKVGDTLSTWGLEADVTGQKLSVAIRLLAAVKTITE